MNHRIFRFFIRVSAFVGKELVDILRQTRLILTLVLGPFLIMLLFGIGYQNSAENLRTLFVVSKDNPIRQQVVHYTQALGGNMIYEGVTDNRDEAMRALSQDKVDLVIVVPNDAYQKLQNGEQVTVQQYDNKIDPAEVNYVKYFGNVVAEEINREVLLTTVQQAQGKAPQIQSELGTARQADQAMQKALIAGDLVAAQQQQSRLNQSLDTFSTALGASLGMLTSAQNSALPNTGSANSQNPNAQLGQLLDQINQERGGIHTTSSDSQNIQQTIARLDKLDKDLAQMQQQITKFTNTSPAALIMPFSVETHNLRGINLSEAAYYTPGVIILLLQHLAVTFAALSFVREQNSGAIELFRVSPVSAFETLLGKYLSFMIFGLITAAMITVTVVYLLGVPMLGSWENYFLVVFIMLFAALGTGFAISLVSRTDTQAVQYAMFLLLGSVFFSGFLLNLDFFRYPIRLVSYALPSTYGIALLQNVMLRGESIDLALILGLTGFGVALLLISWLLFRRKMQAA